MPAPSTINEAYNRIKEYFSQPGARIALEDPDVQQEFRRCVYLAEDGAKCAVGCLMSEEEWIPDIEGMPASEVIHKLGWYEGEDYEFVQTMGDFLDDCQLIHDKSESVESFLISLDTMAENWNIPVVQGS